MNFSLSFNLSPHPQVSQQVVRLVQTDPVGRMHRILIQQGLVHLALLLHCVSRRLQTETISADLDDVQTKF